MARRSRPGRTRPGRTTARPPPSAARGGPLRGPGSRRSPLRFSLFPRARAPASPARSPRLTARLLRAPLLPSRTRCPRLSGPSPARLPGQPRRPWTRRRQCRPDQASLTWPHPRGGPHPQRADWCRTLARRPRFRRVAPSRGVASRVRQEPARRRRMVRCRWWIRGLRFRPGPIRRPRLAGPRCHLPTRRRRFRRGVARWVRPSRARPGPARLVGRCRSRTGRRGGRLSRPGGAGVCRPHRRRRCRRAGLRRLVGGRRHRDSRYRDSRRRLRRSRPARRRSCRPQDHLRGARLGGMSLVPKPGPTRPARALCVLPWRGRTRAA
jgi:hypothetical protein